MKYSNTQQLQQKQQLKLTPQARLVMELQFLNSAALEARLLEVSADNEYLKPVIPVKPSGMASDSFEGQFQREDYSEKYEEIPDNKIKSLNQHLEEQMRSVVTEDGIIENGCALLNFLDEKGVFTEPRHRLADLVSKERGQTVSDADISKAIELMHSLDPAGVGVFGMQERLIVQLEQSGEYEADALILKIVRECFKLLLEKNLQIIADKYDVEVDEITEALRDAGEFLVLNPGSKFAEPAIRIKEDATIDGDGVVTVVSIGADSADTETKLTKEQKAKLKEAKAWKNALLTRSQRLKAFVEILTAAQPAVINGRPEELKPLLMKEVAEQIGVAPSTISRMANAKYVRLPDGSLRLLAVFFQKGLEKKGGKTSPQEIKQRIKSMQEGKKGMKSREIMEILNSEGVKIALETVNKYRRGVGRE